METPSEKNLKIASSPTERSDSLADCFPTGSKWEKFAARPNGRGKFLVCNADEGDPGAYMDRAVLEGNPQSIIEGMLIGAFATGATHGIVYVRNEYPLAIKNLRTALRQARELGLLGERVLGTA